MQVNDICVGGASIAFGRQTDILPKGDNTTNCISILFQRYFGAFYIGFSDGKAKQKMATFTNLNNFIGAKPSFRTYFTFHFFSFCAHPLLFIIIIAIIYGTNGFVEQGGHHILDTLS